MFLQNWSVEAKLGEGSGLKWERFCGVLSVWLE